MRQAAGQAVRHVARRCGVWAHRLAQLALALLIVALVGVGTLAVRLSQGPIELDWLARRMTEMANAPGGITDGPTRLSVRTVQLAWQGMRVGIDSPLELVARDIVITDPRGQSLHLPRATVTVAPRALLTGRVAVRTVELEGLRLRLVREADGTLLVDLGSLRDISEPDTGSADKSEARAAARLADIVALLTAAPGGTGALGALRQLGIRDTDITVVDRKLGLDWRAVVGEIVLNRSTAGGASGRVQLSVEVGETKKAIATQPIRLDARMALLPDGGATLAGTMSEFTPARLAGLVPMLAPLAAVDAPLTLGGTLTLDAGLGLRAATLSIAAKAGTLHLGTGTMPILSAAITGEASPGHATLHLNGLRVAAKPDGPATTITGNVIGSLAAGQISATLTVDIDRIAFADLPVLWPEGIGGTGTRPWIVQNLTGGIVQNGHVALTLVSPDDFSAPVLTGISGGADAHDVTGWWMRPVPPIDRGEARIEFVDPDTMDILITAGRQAGTALSIHDAKIRMTGLAGRDQFMAIAANLGGPLADVLALLHHPAIQIIDKLGLPIIQPAGQVQNTLTVNMPLKTDLTFKDVVIHANGRLTGGHLGGIAVGHDVSGANVDVDVNNAGMHINGTADVAAIPSQIDVAMDFRDGPPTQVYQRVTVAGTVDPPALGRLGLDTKGVFAGTAGANLALSERRDGTGDVAIALDLQKSALDGGMLNWRKEPGPSGRAEFQLRLDRGAIASIEGIKLDAPGLRLAGRAVMAGGTLATVSLQQVVMGEGTNLSSDIALPTRAGQPYRIKASGASVDLSGVLDRHTPDRPAEAKPDQPGAPFSVDARFDRVVMGSGRQLSGVVAQFEQDGTITTSGRVTAQAGDGPFSLQLTPQAGGRVLTGDAADAGGLLRALDVMPDMRGGHLELTGRYDDTKPGRPLAGTAEISDFRIQNAPAIGMLLQAMSLYGLVEVAQGPGLGFNRLIAPFSLENQILTLTDARAYSASLGMTAKGRLDLRRHTAAIEGTVIPAYFFNTLLGRVPLIGRLFSPEEGGGLFAANYSINGPFNNPSVGVNPLSALTPGFLRGFFDIFDSPEPVDGKPRPPARERPSGEGKH